MLANEEILATKNSVRAILTIVCTKIFFLYRIFLKIGVAHRRATMKIMIEKRSK